jgi:hypothetical protein
MKVRKLIAIGCDLALRGESRAVMPPKGTDVQRRRTAAEMDANRNPGDSAPPTPSRIAAAR